MTATTQGSGQALPTGTVTFLFTDIESSTRLLQQLGDRYADVLAGHQRLLRAAFQDRGGHEVDTQGDAFFIAFASARDAAEAAVAAQRAMASHSWPENAPVRVRMGLHTGEAIVTVGGGYVGMDVHRSARICSAGHGGQILLSQTTRILVENDLPQGVSLRNLGEHRLKDLQHPEQVFQLVTPDLLADFPSLKSLDTFPNNLPRQLTRFIGREQEIEEIKRLLADTYLLTLTGSGGCGKTRLALQVIADLLEEYSDGVWVVELAPLSDPSLVTQETAAVLGIREESGVLTMGGGSPGTPSATSGGDSLITRLTEYLKSKQLLLFLDNCEHLIEACIKLVDALLRTCPNLKIIVASREALGIAGESTYRVPSLSLPDPGNMPPLEELARYESIKLFIDRAVAVVSIFKLTDNNAPSVAQICHRLDGIPLAIELAAVRVKALSVEEIRARLDDNFRLLTGGSRAALPRQQTLRATIDWSHNLLSEPEKVLLNRLSVFSGGWTLAAAEEICADEDNVELNFHIHPDEVLDLLTILVDKSLVIAEEVSSFEEGGKTRYRLLEMVRGYSRESLVDSGDAERVRGLHLDYFLRFAEKAEPEIQLGDDQTVWNQLEEEHDNLRGALEWSGESGRTEEGLRTAGALWWFWYVQGYHSEGSKWLEGILTEEESKLSPSVRAKALGGAGYLIGLQGDSNRALELMEESLILYREMGDKRGIAQSLLHLGKFIHENEGDYEGGATFLEEGLSLFRELEDSQGVAALLLFLGDTRLRQGNLEKARVLVEESLTLFQEVVGSKAGEISSLYVLGRVVGSGGDYGRATELYKKSIKLTWEIGSKYPTHLRLEALAEVAIAQDQPERGARLLGAAETIRQDIGVSLISPYDRANHDRSIAALRADLGEEAFEAAWAKGRAMSVEKAIEYALTVEDT